MNITTRPDTDKQRYYDHLGGHALSAREHEVFLLFMQGARATDVAAQLCVTQKTVQVHVSRILAKLRARTMPHAVALYLTEQRRAERSAGITY